MERVITWSGEATVVPRSPEGAGWLLEHVTTVGTGFNDGHRHYFFWVRKESVKLDVPERAPRRRERA